MEDTRDAPPPLTSVQRSAPTNPPPLIPRLLSEPAAPPPLVPRQRGQEASTAPQSDDRASGGIPPLTEIKKGSKAPEIDPQNPPPLVEVKKPSGPPPLEIIQPKPVELPKLEIVQPAAPPPLEIKQRVAIEPPKLEVKHLSPVVYLLIGRNHLNEEISLCQVSPEAEYQKVEKKGAGDLRAFLIGIVSYDMARLLETPDGKEVGEHKEATEMLFPQLTPRQKELGVVFKADLMDHHYYNEDIDRQRSEDADREDDDDTEYTSDIQPEVVYSWMVVRCDLKQIPRLNLSAILST